MKKILILAFLFISFSSANTMATSLKLVWEQTGFKEPESMLYDQARQTIYVSNVDGKPNDKDGKGFISLLATDGKVIKQQWLTGLNAPKGMALVKNTLFVADIDTLVAIDVTTQKIIKRYRVEKAKFLNDVVAGENGDIYVSDFLDNAIYRLQDGKLTLWLADKALQTPNGLSITNNHLSVGSWGVITKGFATDVAGHIKVINLDNKKMTMLGQGKPIGNLDGLEADGQEGYFATDWIAGAILHIKPTGDFEILLDVNQGSADLGIMTTKDVTTLFIPMMKDNVVRAYQVQAKPIEKSYSSF